MAVQYFPWLIGSLCYAKYCLFLQHGTFVNNCCFIRAAKANKKPVLVHKGMVKSLLYQVSKHQGIFLWDKLYKHISTDPWWNPLPPRQLGATQVCQILLPQTKQMMLTCLWCLETWNPPTFLWWARALREEGSRLQIWVLPGFWNWPKWFFSINSFFLGSSTHLWSHWQTSIQWWWLSGTGLQNYSWGHVIIQKYHDF